MARDREHPYVNTLRAQLDAKRIDRREFLRTATLLGLSATAAYAFADKVAPQAGRAFAQGAPKKGGTLRVAMRCQKVDNPHTYSWIESSNTGRAALDYLTRTGNDNVTRPALVEKWEPSEDLKTWTLRLRRDVTWQKDKRKFTADDVVWNLKRVLDPKTGSSVLGLMKGSILEDVDTGEKDDKGQPKKTSKLWDANAVEKVDDFTVRLNLKNAQLAIPEQLYHYPLLMLDPAENGVYKEGSNGTGPFQFVTNEVGRKQVFRANPSYWGGGPHLETLEFIDLGEDPAASVAAIASGQVDLLYGAQIPVIPALDRIPNLQRYLIDTAYTAVARMQPQKPFDDKRVRQAVQWATDLDATLKAAHLGMGRVGEHHHVAPVHPEYAAMQPYKRDVVKAKALLAEAGYPNGVDCELYCQGNTAWELLAAQVMSEQWKEAGIRCKINNVPSTQYWEIWTKVPFGLTTWAHRPLGVMVLGLAYRTGGPWNESKYSNPKFDELLIKAEGLVDVEERRKVMAQLQQILLDDAPIVLPLWRGLSTYAHKKVKGFGLHPSQYIHPHEIWIDA